MVRPLDTSKAVEGSEITGSGFGGASSSGDGGSGDGPNAGSSPRDLAKGKGVVVEEEHRDARAGDAMVHPVAQSSSHRPITREDFAEHVSEEMLIRLLKEHPEVGIVVLSAREERQREVVAAEATARAERARADEEEALREMEAAERAQAEAVLSR